MSVYQLIFQNSFHGTTIFSLSSETLWFVAKEFENYNVFLITLAAFSGAVLAMCITYIVGRLLGPAIKSFFIIDEEFFQKAANVASKYGVYVFLFQMMPVVKILFLFAGIMNISAKRILAFMVAGRAFYYLYYLYILPNIPYYSSMFR